MAVNLATKYSSKVDEAVSMASITDVGVNQDYDFVGARTVKVKSFSTAPMNDYSATGANRYGTPSELDDEDQELTLSKKRSFTFTIDATNRVDSPEGVRDAGKALRRQIDQAVVPEVDTYRLVKMGLGAGNKNYTALTSSNAYSLFLDANEKIDNEKYPNSGRIAYVANDFYKALKLDSNFVKACDIAEGMLISGQVGEVDGVAIKKAPPSMLPAGCYFIITRKEATVAPIKLAEYKIHENPPGIAGHLVEGLVYYDAFVLNQQKKSISAQFGKAGTLTVSMEAGAAGAGAVTVSGITNGMTKLVYKTGASQAAATPGADLSTGWTDLPADGVITATATHKLAVAAVDADGVAIATAAVITVVVGS